ncbi:unnamed protein product [Linum tenue]|uniref:Uncharacterized protein n=1 Tax=Linum tenue TaxID=586396 RepID=A0AAV0RAU7_9ROSI|nr:unnamed protein product [Linum tenue]
MKMRDRCLHCRNRRSPAFSAASSAMTSCRFLLFFCSAILLSAATSSYGSRDGTQKSGKSSVFSLFNLKEKSRFWSEAVIRSDFDDLASSNPAKMGLINYTKAGNIANYLMLQEVDAMYLPVPVNFIFVGFEGKGNRDFKLNPDELERWFTKIDHIFEHTRVPQIGEVLTPFYKISVDKGQRHHLPIISHINYNDEKDALWQVDMDMMDVIFTSLVEYLELDSAYNIFVLNPKHDLKRAKYGYRCVLHVMLLL